MRVRFPRNVNIPEKRNNQGLEKLEVRRRAERALGRRTSARWLAMFEKLRELEVGGLLALACELPRVECRAWGWPAPGVTRLYEFALGEEGQRALNIPGNFVN